MAERYGAGRVPQNFTTEGRVSAPPPEQATGGAPAGAWGGNEYRNGVPVKNSPGADGESYMGRSSTTTGSSKDSGPA